MENFPPNRKTDSPPPEEKQVKQVTSGNVVKRKKSLRKQFSETFVGGDMRTAVRYVMFDVLVPAARDMVAEAFTQGIEKLIFGDSRRRGSTPPQAGPTGYVQYHRMSQPSAPQRVLSRQSRARHNFDEIVLESRSEAQTVLDSLYDILNKYDVVTVADLYLLVGIQSQHTDGKWGWGNLQGAGVTRLREGYLLDLPEPLPLN